MKRSGLIYSVFGGFCLLWVGLIANSATNDVERALVTDSDGDGMTDWQEWQGGTNPGDSNSCLRLLSATVEEGKFILQWTSVSNRTYEIVSAATLDDLATNATRTRFVERSMGTNAWNETISSFTNGLSTNLQFFRVECLGNQSFEESVMDMATFE